VLKPSDGENLKTIIIMPRNKEALSRYRVINRYLLTQPLHESHEVVEERDDEIIFRLRVHPTYELISVFLGCGDDLCVIEPVSLREEIKSALKQAMECYAEPG
jgi:predicted DNA-binding transcriptional regulator YafY